MTVTLSSPVTGTAQTGLTSPTYTHVADTAPDPNAKAYAVTALGGTQTGVSIHSVSSPFLASFWRPKVFKILGKPNPVTGLIANIQNNVFRVRTQKGVTPLAGQPIKMMTVETTITVPAGADLADPANVRAALSMHFGSLSQVSSGLGDTTVQGVL
jgi:hypothetical protein